MVQALDTETSHKGECESYARHVAEQHLYGGSPAEVDELAVQYLSDGTVSCICDEIPAEDASHSFLPKRLDSGDPTLVCRRCGAWFDAPQHQR